MRKQKINHQFASNINVSYYTEADILVPFLLSENLSQGSPIGMYLDNLKKLIT